MPEYEHRQPQGISQKMPEGAALMCAECGCVVADTARHDTWHESLKEKEPKDA